VLECCDRHRAYNIWFKGRRRTDDNKSSIETLTLKFKRCFNQIRLFGHFDSFLPTIVCPDQETIKWPGASWIEKAYGPSIKDVRTKSRKTAPAPLSAKCLHWLNPSCPCGHTITLEKSEVVSTKNCGRSHLKNLSPLVHKMSALDKPVSPLSADVFYGQPFTFVILFKWCHIESY